MFMVKADFAWDDVGTWGSLEKGDGAGRSGNYTKRQPRLRGHEGCVDLRGRPAGRRHRRIEPDHRGVTEEGVPCLRHGERTRNKADSRMIGARLRRQAARTTSAVTGDNEKGCAMVSKVFTSSLIGIDGIRVEVEVDISHGLPSFNIVGLPEPSVKESRERVRAAIKNAGFEFPNDRITINLAPADVRKEGSSFDLPVALGLLAAMGIIARRRSEDHLDHRGAFPGREDQGNQGGPPHGGPRPEGGLRPHASSLPRTGARRAVVKGIDVYGASHLLDIVHYFRGDGGLQSLFLPGRRIETGRRRTKASISRHQRAGAGETRPGDSRGGRPQRAHGRPAGRERPCSPGGYPPYCRP